MSKSWQSRKQNVRTDNKRVGPVCSRDKGKCSFEHLRSFFMKETKLSLGEMPPILGAPLGSPFMRWKSRTYPMLLGAPYLHIGLRILVTFQEKVFKAFTFLMLPEMEV